jgi:predicted SAM-dependent methyltransferase
MEKFLNLGSGARICIDPRWVNVDFISTRKEVVRHNLLQGIPFPDGSFDAVYSSHVLEHFRKEDGKRIVRECHRVLRRGGVVRIAVPDLEQICRLYLTALGALREGDGSWEGRYDWMMLEMYDQAVRTGPGGEMGETLRRENLPDREFILSRIGGTGRDIIQGAPCRSGPRDAGGGERRGRQSRWRWREWTRALLLSRREREALDLGKFRLGGEVHQWMYDGYSLGRLLRETGFAEVRPCDAAGSRISGWGNFFLDTDPDGTEHAPNSIYMEAVRP